MDWFEKITGFRETSYPETQAQLSVRDGRLLRVGTGPTYAVGTLSQPSLGELRARAGAVRRSGPSRLSMVQGDVRALHRAPENRDALFQVASQFNLLEMIGPDVGPEDGVARYEHDRTQGPACAMAAGAATIYRNYLVPIGAVLAQRLGTSAEALWTMRNGYALASSVGLTAIDRYLATADDDALDALRGLLRVGLHEDVEVTDGRAPGPLVSQIFCSALPVAYGQHPAAAWASFARLVLEAAYEATLLAGVLSAARGASNRVLLTRLGGGAFGNADAWIDAALLRALRLVGEHDLDVVIVSYAPASPALNRFVRASGFAKSSSAKLPLHAHVQLPD